MEYINERINKTTIQKLKYLKKYVEIESKKNIKNTSEAFEYFLNYYMKQKNIEMKTDITISEIKAYSNILKNHGRVDNNLTPSLKEDLKMLSKVWKEKGEQKKILDYEGIVRLLLDHYIQSFPDIKIHLLQDVYISQKIELEKLRKERMGIYD